MTKHTSMALVSVLTMTVVSCGQKASTTEQTTPTTVSSTTAASDTTLSGGIVNEHFSEAMAGATDQSSNGATLALDDVYLADGDKSTVTKTCEESGAKAVVTVKGVVDRTNSRTSANGKTSVEVVMKGESSMTRTWSRSNGSAVTCNAAKTMAKVNFEQPSGLVLDLSFTRSRERSMKLVNPRVTKTSSSSFKASGTRTVTWSDNSTSSDTSTTYVRNKSVISKVTREATIKDKDGVERAVKLEMKTKDNAPLVIQVERSKSDHSPVSRNIVSGTMIATKDSTDGSIEISYANLKVNLASGECKLSSGSASANFYDATGALLKTYTLNVDSSGEAQLTDDKGNVVDDFALEGCDPEDLKL